MTHEDGGPARLPLPLRTAPPPEGRRTTLTDALLDVVLRVPGTRERSTVDAAARSRAIARTAALKASLAAGSLALPPGPLGWATILPELVAVWRIQCQMVSDIAGAHGTHAELTREHLLYCLFRYAAAQAVRDLAVRAGQRVLVRSLSAQAVGGVAGQIAVQFTQRVAHRGVTRWLPAVGAAAVGTYAWYDTLSVAKAAIETLAPAPEGDRERESRAEHRLPCRGTGSPGR